MYELSAIIDDIAEYQKSYYLRQLEKIDQDAKDYKKASWVNPGPMFGHGRTYFPGISTASGVYTIIHKPDRKEPGTIFYVGYSTRIGDRRNQHISIYRNGGKPNSFSTNGKITSSNDSIVGRKMHLKDPVGYHWQFSYFECDANWAKEIEEELMIALKPEANDLKMLGYYVKEHNEEYDRLQKRLDMFFTME